MIKECEVQIIEILDDSYYPGICRAVLEDHHGQNHFFVDKVPIFTDVYLDEISQLPFVGYIRVETIKDLGDVIEINTENPDDIGSENGCYRFVVSKDKIRNSIYE